MHKGLSRGATHTQHGANHGSGASVSVLQEQESRIMRPKRRLTLLQDWLEHTGHGPSTLVIGLARKDANKVISAWARAHAMCPCKSTLVIGLARKVIRMSIWKCLSGISSYLVSNKRTPPSGAAVKHPANTTMSMPHQAHTQHTSTLRTPGNTLWASEVMQTSNRAHIACFPSLVYVRGLVELFALLLFARHG